MGFLCQLLEERLRRDYEVHVANLSELPPGWEKGQDRFTFLALNKRLTFYSEVLPDRLESMQAGRYTTCGFLHGKGRG